ncbi:CoA-transferase [Chloroflexota bacterium]
MNLIRKSFELRKEPGNKVLSLYQAIKENVRPGMAVHLAGGNGGPSGAVCEILRQYRQRKADFILISNVIAGHTANLVHCGLVKKIICASFADVFPTPGPSPVVQRGVRQGSVDLENWSNGSLQQRLMAGALGVGFMPTKSVVGSSIAQENIESFHEVMDPFRANEKVGVVRSLNPDISIVHGIVADSMGNTILGLPYGEDLWGAKASKSGVMITVEKIVEAEFIRNHSALVKIPGHIVKSISIVPMGMHPFRLTSPGIEGLPCYRMDEEFMIDMGLAAKSQEALDSWIDEWVLSCIDQEDYLAKLGNQKIDYLTKPQTVEDWQGRLARIENSISRSKEYTEREMMVVAAARMIKQKVEDEKFTALLLGGGVAMLAGWLAYLLLKIEGRSVMLLHGNGLIGYTPPPGDPNILGPYPILTSEMSIDGLELYSVYVSGKYNKCLGVVGMGEIDRFGNINTTRMANGDVLIGSGGLNDISAASEILVVGVQSRSRFVNNVSYVTCPGKRVRAMVTTYGVFGKLVDNEYFVLEAYLPSMVKTTKEERIEEVKSRCGWELEVSKDIDEVLEPTLEELMLVRSLDPGGLFIRKD